MPDKQMIFIIGSPRSGTTWLQTMIGAHPQVAATVELTLFNRYTAPWLKAWKREAMHIAQGDWNQGLPYIWSEEQFTGFLREFLERAYEPVLATKPQATHILDKQPAYSFFVEDINLLFPQARFIHAVRDGRDVAVSMVDARKRYGFGSDSIASSALEWKKHFLAARSARQFQDRYIEVRYEELKGAGVDVLSRVFDFCDLPTSREEVAAIIDAHEFKKMNKANDEGLLPQMPRQKRALTTHRRGKVGSHQYELTPRQRYLFERLAGDLLRDFGYAEEGWWAESVREKLTLPLEGSILMSLAQLRDAMALLMGPMVSERLGRTGIGRLTLDKLAHSLA